MAGRDRSSAAVTPVVGGVALPRPCARAGRPERRWARGVARGPPTRGLGCRLAGDLVFAEASRSRAPRRPVAVLAIEADFRFELGRHRHRGIFARVRSELLAGDLTADWNGQGDR